MRGLNGIGYGIGNLFGEGVEAWSEFVWVRVFFFFFFFFFFFMYLLACSLACLLSFIHSFILSS